MNRLISEFISTFILIFAGTGAIIINDTSGGAITHSGIALTFGLVVFAMIQTFGHVSGAHMNAAVSIAAVAWGKLERRFLVGYICSQLAGALVASLLLKSLFPHHPTLGGTHPSGTEYQSLVLEFFLTFILMISVIGCVNAPGAANLIGPAIGAVIGLEAMFAGPICGASMNPVRSIAPAIVSGDMTSLWIYIVGPIAGALVAVMVAPFVFTTASKTNS